MNYKIYKMKINFYKIILINSKKINILQKNKLINQIIKIPNHKWNCKMHIPKSMNSNINQKIVKIIN